MKVRALITVLLLMLSAAAQQTPAPGVLTSAEVKRVIPQNFFFGGRLAPTQQGQAAGARFNSGKLVLTAILETSGYATSLPQKLQGMLISEVPLSIAGSELKPGAYGFAFNGGKFVVMDVGAHTVLSVGAERDEQMKAAVPLKLVQAGNDYRLYAGRDFVVVKER